MADCCEPGCSDEVLCPVHQALADLRAAVQAKRSEVKALRDGSDGMDLVLRSWEVDILGDVLALIDKEAERG